MLWLEVSLQRLSCLWNHLVCSQMLNSCTRNITMKQLTAKNPAKPAVLQEHRWACDWNLRMEYIMCYDAGLCFTVDPESIQVLLLHFPSHTSVICLKALARHERKSGTVEERKRASGRNRQTSESHTGPLSTWHSVLKLTQQSPVNSTSPDSCHYCLQRPQPQNDRVQILQ